MSNGRRCYHHYYGEHGCQACYKSSGKACKNRAYFRCANGLYCGLHSSRKRRIKLPKNPNASALKKARLESYATSAAEAAAKNRAAGKRGNVILTRLKMMRAPDQQRGYLMIFPNFRHGGRKDGVGLPSLSPMSLRVRHCMPNLSQYPNIENMHQYAKVFALELKSLSDEQRVYFFKQRVAAYADSTPHRHKYDPSLLKKLGSNVNIPLYSIYYNAKGEAKRFSYTESRYFYCKAYEQTATLIAEFAMLQSWIEDGWNLQIMGYDAYPIEYSLTHHYLCSDKPFGHELVLYTLLTVKDPSDYPWNFIYRQNEQIYKGFVFS